MLDRERRALGTLVDHPWLLVGVVPVLLALSLAAVVQMVVGRLAAGEAFPVT